MIITLCGSTKFKETFLHENKRLSLEGHVVLSVGLFGHADCGNELTLFDKARLDIIHFQKILMSDAIRVINPGGYIGESTAREILFARWHGKLVSFLDPSNDHSDLNGPLPINFRKPFPDLI